MLIVVSIAHQLRPFLSYFLPMITIYEIYIYYKNIDQISKQQYVLKANLLRTIITRMIRVIYNQPEMYTVWRVIWASILFLAINYIVFISFMNVCFDTLATRQPVALLVIAFSLMAIDLGIQVFMTRKPFTIGNAIDVVVIFCLVLSFSLFGLFKNMVFLQVVALFKLQDTAYYNVMVYNMVKKHGALLKIYVVTKISYWVILVGHILGCIFYAIDNYLIKTEYFGPLALNPNLYYMGSEHCFTSLYALSEEQRYIYAIYYSYALLSTVAFGDIIGHNYIQDAMVCVYLFFATVSISLIIEQMYIVFRKEKTLRYELISRLKYVSEFIKTQPKISKEFRHELINYMISAQWKEITSTPKISELTSKLEKNLFQESILSKTQDPLPLIIRASFMPLLKSKYFPANYFLIDNNRLQNHLDGRIILKGKFNVGYTRQLIGRKQIKTECISYGFDQLVIGTNFLHKYLTVQLVEQAQVFVLNDDNFNTKLDEFKDYVNDCLPSTVEFYQISVDQILERNRSNHYCFSCDLRGHDLVDCPKFHYNPRLEVDQRLVSKLYIKHCNKERETFRRKNTKSKKNLSRKNFNTMKAQKQGRPDLAIHFQLIGRMMNQNNIFQTLLSKVIINYVEDRLMNSSNDEIDGYHVWKIYCPNGRL